MPYLHLSFHDKRIATYELGDDDITIGRSSDNDIQIDNPGVSSSHAVIRKDRDTYVLEDLSSKNGTYVKGIKVSMHPLEYGDVITVFKHQLRFVAFVGSDVKLTTVGGGENNINQSETVAVDMSSRPDIVTSPRSDNMKISLAVTGTDSQSRTYLLSQQNYTIGKDKDCLVKTSGLMVPALSAKLTRQGNGYLLTPLRQAEIQLNGIPLNRPHVLINGDEFHVRGMRIRYKAEVFAGS